MRWFAAVSGESSKMSQHISVIGEANDGDEAVRMAQELRPQVIVMDCALPGMNGLEATRRILAIAPKTAVLMLSMHSEETGCARRSPPAPAGIS